MGMLPLPRERQGCPGKMPLASLPGVILLLNQKRSSWPGGGLDPAIPVFPASATKPWTRGSSPRKTDLRSPPNEIKQARRADELSPDSPAASGGREGWGGKIGGGVKGCP